MHGILNLTNAPKFAVVSPTEKAKKIENNIENKTSGCLPIKPIIFPFNRIIRKKAKNKI